MNKFVHADSRGGSGFWPQGFFRGGSVIFVRIWKTCQPRDAHTVNSRPAPALHAIPRRFLKGSPDMRDKLSVPSTAC